ncbi:MAG: bifunctional phosphopantothenoylcysteine decarboxylase/phosphopantothenate--cysteine ligase CoaBC [Bacteroidetes bacterium]|jgi:phosphopantothenoylcysteine decarboxylase/phosphopantothenate--cysteine ligase|nr:bifunctional phosphopantothenoylcysteine decarboxylase/phosphopantothenate--cysteine ligase CoaBC [Bacteroidota bacterium]MCL5033988.1 bifunctional phosphopantothenoylcysteine decarboxylase/phosphopantothenate--cysteine ligase CoaBC [Bacteroidota bacterium]
MSALTGKRIILGVCGSIAAYKSAFLLRELQGRGAEVRVVMTPSAAEFVAPLTFSALSHNQVYMEMFPDRKHSSAVGTWHIDLGLWADAMLVAPITASTIAKIAQGISDNFLTSIVLALRAPLIIAPAMDADMYIHPATTSNIAKLKERGVVVVEPEEGELASGLSGVGRLADVTGIVREVERFFEGHHLDLARRKILVTAGPTQEPIDAVRFISNRSSGKMGFAVASAAANRGADVKLITGPVALETPRNVRRVNVSTADQMFEAVAGEIEWCDALIMTAAVADYKVLNPPDRKIKKTEFVQGTPRIELAENVDILKSVAPRKGRRVFVGFALETDDTIANAKKKLVSKSLDLIVVNNPRVEGAGFGTDTNRVAILSEKDQDAVELPLLSKYDVAMNILDRILPLLPQK